MTTKQLKKRGFHLLRLKPFSIITQKTRATLIITLSAAAKAEGRYFELIDNEGNLMLVKEANLDLDEA